MESVIPRRTWRKSRRRRLAGLVAVNAGVHGATVSSIAGLAGLERVDVVDDRDLAQHHGTDDMRHFDVISVDRSGAGRIMCALCPLAPLERDARMRH
jgi:hypothetical protein